MSKSLFKAAFYTFILKFSTMTVSAYHQGEDTAQGGSLSLPQYETVTEQILYLALPGLLLVIFLQQLFEYVVDRKYIQASYKDPADYRAYTTAAAIITVLPLMVSRVFHSLHALSTLQVTAISIILLIATIAINKRDRIREIAN